MSNSQALFAKPHQESCANDLQGCISLVPHSIEALVKLGSTSGAYEVALWFANHVYVSLQALSAGALASGIGLELKKLLRDSERVCTLIAVSCSLDNEESEDVLNIASDLSSELGDRVEYVISSLRNDFEKELPRSGFQGAPL